MNNYFRKTRNQFPRITSHRRGFHMCNRIQSRCLGTMLFGVATVLLLAVSPAFALTTIDPADGCAQTLGTAGEYVLTGDLNCSGTFGNGINITASNVIFHLAGHTISSTDCDLTKAISGLLQDDGPSIGAFFAHRRIWTLSPDPQPLNIFRSLTAGLFGQKKKLADGDGRPSYVAAEVAIGSQLNLSSR